MRCPICGEALADVDVKFNLIERTTVSTSINLNTLQATRTPVKRITDCWAQDFKMVCPVCNEEIGKYLTNEYIEELRSIIMKLAGREEVLRDGSYHRNS
jgi:uncharacterized protein with PIN domain